MGDSLVVICLLSYEFFSGGLQYLIELRPITTENQRERDLHFLPLDLPNLKKDDVLHALPPYTSKTLLCKLGCSLFTNGLEAIWKINLLAGPKFSTNITHPSLTVHVEVGLSSGIQQIVAQSDVTNSILLECCV
ncbi:hypothetical protein Cni_G28390 [Canna indica]|uniref:Uncharacterized protein n=1 Tax=Canna indica TaxID=4628 RepID=A0AAQ3QSB3_9LILI|nr:hypothetical protein Cni_G28390 [Canna indica]